MRADTGCRLGPVVLVAVCVCAVAALISLAGSSVNVGRSSLAVSRAAQLAERDLQETGDQLLVPQLVMPMSPQLAIMSAARNLPEESGATLVYLSASAQRDRMGWQAADRHKKLGGQPRAVGYIFLPEATGDARQGRAQRSMHKRPGIEAQQVLDSVQDTAKSAMKNHTVDNPEYERKFLPFLPCSVWGGDQVVCMSPDGNTTVTVVMDDGTTTPGEQVNGTFKMPGNFLKHPSEHGDCYSSCDFYWAWTVLGAIPGVLLCICICCCICCLCGCWANWLGTGSKKDKDEDTPLLEKNEASTEK